MKVVCAGVDGAVFVAGAGKNITVGRHDVAFNFHSLWKVFLQVGTKGVAQLPRLVVGKVGGFAKPKLWWQV